MGEGRGEEIVGEGGRERKGEVVRIMEPVDMQLFMSSPSRDLMKVFVVVFVGGGGGGGGGVVVWWCGGVVVWWCGGVVVVVVLLLLLLLFLLLLVFI